MAQRATQMCVSVCGGLTNGGDAFSITTVPPSAADVLAPTGGAVAFAGTLSAVGTTFFDASALPAPGVNTAVCLYDFLLIAGGRDTNGVEADRYCGNALNPAPLPLTAAAAALLVPPPANALLQPAPGGLPTSTQVCSRFN
jgi:hypothetical protein